MTTTRTDHVADAAGLPRAWRDAEAAWTDRDRHRALVGLAARHDCLAWLAARYRARAGDPVADEQLGRIARAAAALMAARSRPREVAASSLRPLVRMVVVLALAIATALASATLARERLPSSARASYLVPNSRSPASPRPGTM